MEKYGVYSIAILLAVASLSYGRPTEDPKKEKFRSWRLEVELLRTNRPCNARLLEVRTDMEQFGDIQEDPHYIPDCDPEGILWKSAQCDHHDAGSCFCVHEEDGTVMNHTRTLRLNKEALKCGRRIGFNAHTDHMCFHMQDEFNHMQKEFGLQGHSPLAYFPECTKNGKFVAMQRDGNSKFFCVDIETGDIIPDTMITAGRLPPLTVYICEAYDKVWQDFKSWNATDEKSLEKTVTKESCKKGFTFTECGCPKVCTSESKADDKAECACKPACLCPDGKWELDGECVSLEECHEVNPKSNVLFSQKVEALTAGKFSKWKQYQLMNPNKVLETYNSIGVPTEEQFGDVLIASDVDPNAVSFFHEGPELEEELSQDGHLPQQNDSQEQNLTSQVPGVQGRYYGAEPLPSTGGRVPIFIAILGGKVDLTPIEIKEIVETGTISGPTTLPTEETESTEFDPFAESFNVEPSAAQPSIAEPSVAEAEAETETESYESYIQYYYDGEEETTNNNEPNTTSEEYYNYGETTEYNDTNTTTEEYYYNPEDEEPGSEIQEEEEYINENLQSEETSQYEPYQPQSTEESQPEVEQEEEEFGEESIDSTLPSEEAWLPAETEEGNWIENPLDEENIIGTSPEEQESHDEATNHQKKFTSVPIPPNDEQKEHSSTPPCEENENQHETSNPTTATEEAKTLINRVLSANKIIGNFKTESPSVKKSIGG